MRKQPDNKSREIAASDNQQQQKPPQQQPGKIPGDPTPDNPTPTNPTHQEASIDSTATKDILKGNKKNSVLPS